MFRLDGNYIVNEKGKVLDVHGGVDAENRNVITWTRHKGINQHWDVIYADEYPDEPGKGELNERFGLYVERPFYIVSALPAHRYLDHIGNANLVIKVPNGRNSQVWYFHQQSLTIRTKVNNQSWNIDSNGGAKTIRIYSTNSNWWQLFRYEGDFFINWHNGKVLDVSGGKDVEGQAVWVWTRQGGANQKWKVIYLDEAKKIPTEGFNKEYGFYINDHSTSDQDFQ